MVPRWPGHVPPNDTLCGAKATSNAAADGLTTAQMRVYSQENGEQGMKFDFDRVIDRRNTHSAKWDRIEGGTLYKSGLTPRGPQTADAIPMWIADMDFAAPPAVKEALLEEVNRSTHGYYSTNETWRQACAAWQQRRHGFEVDPDWISTTPGIVSGLGLILQALSEPGDEVVVFSPAYHAFGYIIAANDRKIHNVPMLIEQGRHRMDIDGLKASISDRAKVVFLCSPHNPGGRVWAREELIEVAQFCVDHDLILVSDEIHSDLVYPGHRHIPTAVAAPFVMDRLITCVAATKTFNLAGAHVGALITSNPLLRSRIDGRIHASGLPSYNLFGMIATEAAWRHGEEWLDALIPYLDANRKHFDARIVRAIPGARSMPLESTYLAWVDMEGTGLSRDEFMDRIAFRARIGVSPGPQFGPGGEMLVRFNFATQRYWIDQALARLEEAFAG
jgi:cystathionine beta-lyase